MFREYLARSSSGLPPCILERAQNPVFLFPARMCLVRRHLNSYLTSALSCLSPKTVAIRPANLTHVLPVLPLTTSLPRDMSLSGRGILLRGASVGAEPDDSARPTEMQDHNSDRFWVVSLVECKTAASVHMDEVKSQRPIIQERGHVFAAHHWLSGASAARRA